MKRREEKRREEKRREEKRREEKRGEERRREEKRRSGAAPPSGSSDSDYIQSRALQNLSFSCSKVASLSAG